MSATRSYINTSLCKAINDGNIDEVKKLINTTSDINAKGLIPFENMPDTAVISNPLQVVYQRILDVEYHPSTHETDKTIAVLLLQHKDLDLDQNSSEIYNLICFALRSEFPEIFVAFLNNENLFASINNYDNKYGKQGFGFDKEFLFSLINRIKNQDVKLEILKKAIDPSAELGKFFWKKRGYTNCSLNSGILKRLNDTYNMLKQSVGRHAGQYSLVGPGSPSTFAQNSNRKLDDALNNDELKKPNSR